MTSFQLVILVCTELVRQETPFLPSCHLKQPFSLVTQCSASPMICYNHSMNLTGFPAFSTGVQADPTSFPLEQKMLTKLTACLFPRHNFQQYGDVVSASQFLSDQSPITSLALQLLLFPQVGIFDQVAATVLQLVFPSWNIYHSSITLPSNLA